MERSVLRILGKRGRTTIPRPIRTELDFAPGDVLLFEYCQQIFLERRAKA